MAMQLATVNILIKSKKLHILPNLVIEGKFLHVKSEKFVTNCIHMFRLIFFALKE